MAVPVFEVPGVFRCSWDGEARAVLGRWESFRTRRVREIVTRHVHEGGRRGAGCCVVDVTGALGVPDPEDADWIDTAGAALLARARIATLVNVVPSRAPVRRGAERWASAARSHGVEVHSCATLAEALAIAAEVFRQAPAGSAHVA